MGTWIMNGTARIDKVNYLSKYNRRSDGSEVVCACASQSVLINQLVSAPSREPPIQPTTQPAEQPSPPSGSITIIDAF